MGPECIRIGWGFARLGTSALAVLTASPALAQTMTEGIVTGAMPVTVLLGAGAFALVATVLVRRTLKEARRAQRAATGQVAHLRALVDEYEALLSGMPEIMVLWTDADGPRFLGQPSTILPPGRRADAVLDLTLWLEDSEADRLTRALEALRVGGQGFEIALRARDGRAMRATGVVLGGGTVLRVRPAAGTQSTAATAPSTAQVLDVARALVMSLPEPAFLRDAEGHATLANPPLEALVRGAGRRPEALAELIGPGGTGGRQVTFGGAGVFALSETPIPGGMLGRLTPAESVPQAEPADSGLDHLTRIIDALATPIAVFDAGRGLVQANRAYAQLWGLDPRWLKPGLDERTILDRLRTEGLLPAEPDYHAWRAKHLGAYQFTGPRELDPWHLPDGRTVQVIAAPAGPGGGVIYVFEDITAQLNLQSQHRSLLDVQRSTINALTEAVAVFGTNGRLTLYNPRFSALWRVPTNVLEHSPHIDRIAEAAAGELPEDGARIWGDLKRRIINLDPNRIDQQGRITRADGKLIDYAVTRLPDGQSMMTFLDVTESARFQQVLKERNEALETADRLKDAFVQNVSYELRSPLTNIIGFADLLSSETAGVLNERQRAYTDYIRASSVTLGVLIDNILDLATVDAGIAELRPEPQDVAALVEKARAGLAATFLEVDGERALNLVIDVAPDLPTFVADGTRVVQVLYNLLSSAARYSEPGGEVKLVVRARGAHVQFIVEDEGAPMPPEAKAALLGRDNAGHAGRERGAGLGLAIVRAFVNLHGGTVTVEARPPRGTRVTVSLPRDAAIAGAAE